MGINRGPIYNHNREVNNIIYRLSNIESSDSPEEIDRLHKEETSKPRLTKPINNHPIELSPEYNKEEEILFRNDNNHILGHIGNLLHSYNPKYFLNPATKLEPIKVPYQNAEHIPLHVALVSVANAIAPHVQILGNNEHYISREGHNIAENTGHYARDFFEEHPGSKDSIFGDPEEIYKSMTNMHYLGDSGSPMHNWIATMLYNLHLRHEMHKDRYRQMRYMGQEVPSNRPMPLSHYADTFWYWNKLPLWLQSHVRSGLHKIVDDPEKPFNTGGN